MAILRDPVDRCVSAFFFVTNHGTARVRLSAYWRQATRQIRTFDDYLDFLEGHRLRLHKLDFVMRPQAHYVLDDQHMLIVDKLFLMGRDDAALQEYIVAHGGRSLPHLNTGLRESLELTREQRGRVESLYAMDLELIGRLG